MSIDVCIKQKLFGNKPMPLEVILGEHLHYGNLVNDLLNVGELGETEFLAYNPKSIGRGFSVIWNPQEKKTITLRLPQPSTVRELRDFYDAIGRMVAYWDGKLTVDGMRVRLSDFMSGFDSMVELNQKFLLHCSQQALNGQHETLMFYAAMWPLYMGKEEAIAFLEDPKNYAQWLHEKQSMDVYYANPCFYEGEHGLFARYSFTNNLPTVFPYQPVVPLGITDLQTGKPMECEQWLICLGIAEENEPLCQMEYSQFLSLIPEDKKSRYDATHFLLAEMSEDEIRNLCAQQ